MRFGRPGFGKAQKLAPARQEQEGKPTTPGPVTSPGSGGGDLEPHEIADGSGLGDHHFIESGLSQGDVLQVNAAGDDAFFGGLDHSFLDNVLPNQHHNQAHVIDGADHTAAGLTAGHVMVALSATTFGFRALSSTATAGCILGAWAKNDISGLSNSGNGDELFNSWSKGANDLMSQVMPVSGVVTHITLFLDGDVGGSGDNLTITLFKNGSATAMTLVLTGGAGTEYKAYAASGGPITFAAGDELTIYGKRTGTLSVRKATINVFGLLDT